MKKFNFDSIKRIIITTYLFIAVLFLSLLFSGLLYNDIKLMKTKASLLDTYKTSQSLEQETVSDLNIEEKDNLDDKDILKQDSVLEQEKFEEEKAEEGGEDLRKTEIFIGQEQTDYKDIETETGLESNIDNVFEAGRNDSLDAFRIKGDFIQPQAGDEISGKIDILFKFSKEVDYLEFYIVRRDALSEVYLGRAFLSSNKKWRYVWDTSKYPNGSYYLVAKIMKDNRFYEAGKIYISIKNQILTREERRESLETEIEEINKEIKEKEKKIDEKNERLLKETEEKISKLSERIKNLINPEREEVKKEIDEKFHQISKKIIEEPHSYNKIKEEVQEVENLISQHSQEQKEVQEIKENLKETFELSLKERNEILEEKKKIEQKKKEFVSKDSDKDGVSDMEEIRLGTDPFNADSDQDGFLDSSEIVSGTDPLSPSPSDKIKYQHPRETKPKISNAYRVKKVEIIKKEETKEKVLRITGAAPPFSFVTVYIYSLPTIIIAKADADGNWECIFDKPLSEGRHSVYAAVTNVKGEIEKSSSPFDFIKTEGKVIDLISLRRKNLQAPVESLHTFFSLMIFITIFVQFLRASFLS